MKFQILRIVRATGLLGFADTCKFRIGQARSQSRNRRFAHEFPEFPTPPRHLAFDALNHVDWYSYRESGIAHAQMFARAIREAAPAEERLDVLEWGCGPGRIIRHMPQLLGRLARSITGSDYNTESVAWCRMHLPAIQFAHNQLHPPLPFANSSFHIVYCFSVLTHLSAAVQLEWMAELMRVLRPGGTLICTTHGDAYRYLLASQAERARFDAGEVVVQGNYQEGKKWFFAIHPESFVRQHLLTGFVDVRRQPTGAGDAVLQDVWVARKPA